MNWKIIIALLATAPAQSAPEPQRFTELTTACQGKSGWADPAPPARLDGQVYLVGTCGITVLLITSPQGHILIDSGVEKAAPLVLGNIRKLGFDPKDVKWLLASHTHHDHTGGHAALQAATGAKVAALPVQARELELGTPMPDDPQFGLIEGFAPVKVDRVLRDGAALIVGQNRVTGYATPGHTSGSTSWVIRACGTAKCPTVTYADSTSAISTDAYRFTDHPAWVAQFRRGVARIGALPCRILVTPHPGSSSLFERLSGSAPLIDGSACKRYSDGALAKLNERLAKEASAK